jgi:hypothetical protein
VRQIATHAELEQQEIAISKKGGFRVLMPDL